MIDRLKKYRYRILIIAAWVVLIGILIGYGISSEKNDPHYAGEETVVSVTGSSAELLSSDNSRSDGKGTYDKQESKSGSSDNTQKGNKKATSDKTERTDSGKVRQADSDTIADDTDKNSAHSNPHVATPKPKSSATPKPSATPGVSTYTFTIECRRILDKKELWRDGLSEVIPASGIFFQGKRKWKKDESVYDALVSICDENNILLDSQYTPLYETYYVSGIGNLYEFDCGSESGWKYSVNGKLPGVGCSRCLIEKDDEIVFFYDYRI